MELWRRHGPATVRASVVIIAPEVSGRIVELHVIDNQHVRKGDLLTVIDPTNYTIAVSQAEASVQQAQASVQTIDAQMIVQQAQINANRAQLDQAQAGLAFAQKQAARYQDLAQKGAGTIESAQQFATQLAQQQAAVRSAEATLELAQRQVESQKAQRLSAEATLAQAQSQLRQAQANLQRTRILSPVDGYVTNLLAQLGDFVNVGTNAISLVDAQSYWVDGYFEETNLASIRMVDAAQIKLMGHSKSCAAVRQHRPRDQRFERTAQQSGRRRSIRSSPGCVLPSAFRFEFTSMTCRPTPSFRPE